MPTADCGSFSHVAVPTRIGPSPALPNKDLRHSSRVQYSFAINFRFCDIAAPDDGDIAKVLHFGPWERFSKVLFPALRLGYMVIPFDLLHRFEAALSLTIRHAPLLEQLVLCDFISEGHFGRHLRRMREVYAERQSILLEEARLRLSGLLEISTVEAGLQTTGWLSDGMNAESAATAAAKLGVDVTPVDRYSLGRIVPQALQLGFAVLDAKEIRRGVRDLAIALQDEWKHRDLQKPGL